jgi:polyhydroxyalkanoate synthesis regulator phasin
MPSPKSPPSRARSSGRSTSSSPPDTSDDGASGLAEQLLNRIIRPLGLVVLSRDRIQEILDEAASRGRVTRSDANELTTELVNRGRQQTEQLMSDVERLLGRGRQQLESATVRARRSESLDLLLRNADRARRTVGAGQSFPILGYDDLTAAQVQSRLDGLSAAELRKVRDYERRHANRKSVLAAIDKRA